jgi:hypothetical protein
MKKSGKVILLLLFIVVFACGLSIWTECSPAIFDYRLIHNRDTNDDVLFAFATALRINHTAAYDMIDPSLKPQLDEWMDTHQVQRCKNIPHVTLIWPATKYGKKVEIVCYGRDEIIDFVVDNIVIIDLKVIDWGEGNKID